MKKVILCSAVLVLSLVTIGMGSGSYENSPGVAQGGGFVTMLTPLIFFLIFGTPGAYIAWKKGRSIRGWLALCGFFPFLLIFIIFLPPVKEVEGKVKQCPACKEFVKWGATICKHCRSEINYQ